MRAYPANQLTSLGQLGHVLVALARVLADDPREANSEGGVFPAIFGTVAMTLIMSLLVVPFGVLAALYLREYAKAGPIVSVVRIAINNLAGVPSIVFGVFGLGFFCYVVGARDRSTLLPRHAGRNRPLDVRHRRDAVGLADAGPADAAGRDRHHRRGPGGGAQLDARRLLRLRRQQMANHPPHRAAAGPAGHHDRHDPGHGPRGRRSRAADAGRSDETRPPSCRSTASFPIVHLERSFMHLGFHIYDLGFHSQNSEAAASMVFTTTLLLIAIVAVLNMTAIWLRARLRRRYRRQPFLDRSSVFP